MKVTNSKITEAAIKLLKVCENCPLLAKTDYIGVLGFCLALRRQDGSLTFWTRSSLNLENGRTIDFFDYFNKDISLLFLDSIGIVLERELLLNCPEVYFGENKDLVYADLFEEIISIVIKDLHSHHIDKGFLNELPKEIIHFATHLYDGDLQGKNIFIPFAGTGSFLLQEDFAFAKAYEANKQLWLIGLLRLMFRNMDSSLFINTDPFIYNNNSNIKHDLVFLNTPTGDLPDDIRIDKASKIVHSYQHTDSTNFAIEYALNNIKPEGSVIAIVPDSFLSRGNEFSKRLFMSDYIDTIIQLPDCYHKTLIIFKKNQDSRIRMVNGGSESDFCTENEDLDSYVFEYEKLLDAINKCEDKYVRYIEKKKIIAYNKTLFPFWYVDDIEEEFVPLGHKTYKFGDFLKPFDKIPLKGIARVINARSMYREAFVYQLNEDKRIYACEKDHYLLNDDLIIFPDFEHWNWNERVMYYSHKNREDVTCASNSVLSFRFNSNLIDPLFFCMECESAFIKKQLARIRTPYLEEAESWPIDALLDVKILLPTNLEEQKSIYSQAKDAYRYEKLQELGFEEILRKREEDINLNLKSKLHGINGKFPNIYSRITYLKKRANEMSVVLEKKANETSVVENHNNLLKILTKFRDRLNILETDIEKIANEIQIFDTSDFIKEGSVTNLCKSIYNYKTTENYKVEHIINDNIDMFGEANVFIGNENFDSLMQNIINNACRHGFINEENEHIIRLELSFDAINDYYILQISNNGVPMEESINTNSYSSYGVKAGKTSNTGLGGYIIETIVKRFNGSVEVEKTASLFPVKIIIKLPKYKEYDTKHFMD